MLEIVLTREDANTEFALLAEWLVEDRAEVTAGQPVCVVETTKATVEVEAPGAGTIVQLYGEGVEVELGKTIAYVAESADELAAIDAKAEEKPAPKPAAGDRKATRKARRARRAARASTSRRSRSAGSSRRRTSRTLIAAQKAVRAPAAGPALAGVSTAGVSLPATFELDESCRRARSGVPASRSTTTPSARSRPRRRSPRSAEPARDIGEGVELGEGSLRRRATCRDRGRRADRPACDGRLRGGRRDRRAHAVRRRPRAALPARVPRRGGLGRALDPHRRRRSSGPVGDARGRRPRVRRRRGVRQRLPAGAHRARGVPDDALADRHAQHRPLGARGLREPLRSGRARGPRAGRARRGALRRRADRRRGDRRVELVRRRRRFLRARSRSAFPRR